MSTTVEYRPTLLNSCAYAATAEEVKFRIQAPIEANRSSRIIALDDEAARILQHLAEMEWTGDAHFMTFDSSTPIEGLGGVAVDARLKRTDGTESLLSEELDGADVAVMLATTDDGAEGAEAIGEAAFARGVMTAGVVVAEGGQADRAVAALRPDAMVLLVTKDEGAVPDLLTALRV